MTYVIGSGWWCPGSDALDSRDTLHGEEEIRTSEFHLSWHEAIARFADPRKIFIVDSESPVKPPHIADTRIELVSLPENPGHSTNHRGRLSGWTRSVLLGLAYAQVSDVEHFVYVEQDVLLYGEEFIERCIDRMNHPYMFGDGSGTPQPIQQSFFIIRRDGFENFRHRLMSIEPPDRHYTPESKFRLAASSLPRSAANLSLKSAVIRNATGYWLTAFPSFDLVPFGAGRARPIDWNASHFYFQWGSQEELERYRTLTRSRPSKT